MYRREIYDVNISHPALSRLNYRYRFNRSGATTTGFAPLAGRGLAFYRDPASGKPTLFMQGHSWYPGFVAQVEVPADANLVRSNDWSDLVRADEANKLIDVKSGAAIYSDITPYALMITAPSNRCTKLSRKVGGLSSNASKLYAVRAGTGKR